MYGRSFEEERWDESYRPFSFLEIAEALSVVGFIVLFFNLLDLVS